MSLPPHVLREYALLADGERGALIGPRGDIAWLCVPGWSDPAIFAALIGGGGSYSVTPRGRYVWGGHYEPGTLIWRSRWVTESGIVECREALAFPGSAHSAVILRRLEVLSGEARLEVVCEPAGEYGQSPARDLACQDGVWRGRAGTQAFCWTGGGSATAGGGTLRLTCELAAGEHHDFALSIGSHDAVRDCDEAWQATEAAWRAAVPPRDLSIAQRDGTHARAVLRGLTSAAGGMVAAATMSLPERAQAGRAYDYRFAWVRDQAMAGQAAARAGDDALLDSAVAFLCARLHDDGPRLAPAYTVAGGPTPAERHVGLPGYPGGSDIAGNHAGEQFQLDAFGEALLCLADADRRDRLDADGWRAVELAARAIAERHEEPDAGIWELDDAHWTHSRLICAAGLRCAAARPAAAARAEAWRALADELVAWADRARMPAGAWQRSPSDSRLDAALVFPALRGATAVQDPRATATVDAVRDELSDEFFAYRYRPDERPLGEAEGAFLLCGFGMALALNAAGRPIEAAHWFERNRSACGPPGLLAEEFDVVQRQLRGNLPQAFVHALLLECAATLPGVEIDRNDEKESI